MPSSSQHLASPHANSAAKDVVRDWMARRAGADQQMRTAASKRTPDPAPPDNADDQDVVAMLTREHNQVRALVQQLSALPGHKKGGSAADIARRKSIVDVITARLSRHESAEEKYLWPAVRRALPDGDAWADTAVRQERRGDETLAALGRLDPDSDDFDEHVERLAAQLRQHVAYETKVFALLREKVDDTGRRQLGEEMSSLRRAQHTQVPDDEGKS